MTTLVCLVIGAVITAAVAAYNQQKARKHRQHIAETYGKSLGLKYRQLVVRDEYGHANFDRWERELNYFMRNALGMTKPKKSQTWDVNRYAAVRAVVDSVALEYAQTLPVMSDVSEVLNGIDYEHFVAKLCTDAGWDSTVTQASRDQGADVIIRLENIDAVLQCKWYKNAVGNKSVQEAAAARRHYNVGSAVVVGKSGFTDAARELASTNGVILIHHDEIPDLHERLSTSASTLNVRPGRWVRRSAARN